MDEILKMLEIYLTDAEAAIHAKDEDAWLTAMNSIRACSWEGKALILDKRWAERPRTPLKRTQPGSVDDIMDLLA